MKQKPRSHPKDRGSPVFSPPNLWVSSKCSFKPILRDSVHKSNPTPASLTARVSQEKHPHTWAVLGCFFRTWVSFQLARCTSLKKDGFSFRRLGVPTSAPLVALIHATHGDVPSASGNRRPSLPRLQLRGDRSSYEGSRWEAPKRNTTTGYRNTNLMSINMYIRWLPMLTCQTALLYRSLHHLWLVQADNEIERVLPSAFQCSRYGIPIQTNIETHHPIRGCQHAVPYAGVNCLYEIARLQPARCPCSTGQKITDARTGGRKVGLTRCFPEGIVPAKGKLPRFGDSSAANSKQHDLWFAYWSASLG